MKKPLFRYYRKAAEVARNLAKESGNVVVIKTRSVGATTLCFEETAKRAWEMAKIKRGTWDAFNKTMEEETEVDLSYMFELEPDYRGLFYEAYRLKGTQFILEVPVTKDWGLSWGQYIPNEEPSENDSGFDDIDFGELEKVEFAKVFEDSPPKVQEDLMMHFDIFGD
jgi:hypothetical protein